jgi:hypothetical protein
MYFIKSFYYRLFVFAVIMPINGYIIGGGTPFPPIIGFLLIALQIPWFVANSKTE